VVLALGGDLYDEQLRVRVEAQLIELAFEQLDALLQTLTKAGFRYYIQTVGIFSHQPYVRVNHSLGMDMQMNIFGYRA
jgi:hypothetical protein